MKIFLRNLLLSTQLGRVILLPLRFVNAVKGSNIFTKFHAIITWLFASQEYGGANYTTDTENQIELCYLISNLSKRGVDEILSYRDEFINDIEIERTIADNISASNERYFHDPVLRVGKRLKFYLLVRALRPEITVEAGVDRGLGALIINYALQRNANEGYQGRYIGIESNREKNILFVSHPKLKFGEILFGDSIEEIEKMEHKIDLFFHETLSTPDHVARQLSIVYNKMSSNGVVTTPWSTKKILDFAFEKQLKVLAHKDRIERHWYEGATHLFVFRST